MLTRRFDLIPVDKPCDECGSPGEHIIFVYCNKCRAQIDKEYTEMVTELIAARKVLKVVEDVAFQRASLQDLWNAFNPYFDGYLDNPDAQT